MIDCISVENMRESDAYTIAKLVPSLELMYRAAYGVFKAVNWRDKLPSWLVPATKVVMALRLPAS